MDEVHGNFTDKRRTFTFHIDDALIDCFGEKLGVYGVAIYAYLARRAKQSRSFPSIRRIAKDLHCSVSKVQTTLQELKDDALITIEARMSDYGDRDSNLYTLCDLSHLRGVPPHGTPVPPNGIPVPGGDTQVYRHTVHGVPPHGTEGISMKGSQGKDLKTPPPPSRGMSGYAPGFALFWQTYPADRRDAKKKCFEVWRREKLEPRTAEIVEKVQRLKDTLWLTLERRFIKQALTWLTQGCYDTELYEAPSRIPTSLYDAKTIESALITQKLIQEYSNGHVDESVLHDTRRQPRLLS